MPSIADIKNPRFEKISPAPGESMSVDLSSYGDNPDDAEFYQIPGSIGMPHDEEIGLIIEAKGNNIIVASHNYKIVISGLEKGEHQIFSYDSDGNILSSAKCNKDGEFVINEGTRDAARKDDQVQSTNTEDTTFWTWIAQAAPILAGLGVTAPPPTTLIGKITQGTDKVKLP